MEFIPYSCQNIDEQDIEAVCGALRSEYVTQGPTIPIFEKDFAHRHGASHAVAVSNATAGLHIALMALGVGPGSKVWTSPNSFVASANAVLYCGAEIDFVDIASSTRNMSLEALRAKLDRAAAIGALPDVVIPVDFAGMSADLREIRCLADQYNFRILEDASHATGASYLGNPVGSKYADATVFSFHAVKVITTCEGGMVVTNENKIAGLMRQLRSHGITRSRDEMERESPGGWYYEQQVLGFNYRMTEIQAALGISQLRRLDAFKLQRNLIADRYADLLVNLPLILPITLDDRESAWHIYSIEIDEAKTNKSRATVFQYLMSENIGVNVHYIPIHLQPYYARLGFRKGDFPASERYYDRAISIPLFPTLTEAQQMRVVFALRKALLE